MLDTDVRTSRAFEKASDAGKKTIQPKDVFDALADLEFSAFLPRVTAEHESEFKVLFLARSLAMRLEEIQNSSLVMILVRQQTRCNHCFLETEPPLRARAEIT